MLFVFTEHRDGKPFHWHFISVPDWGAPYKSGESPYVQIGTYEAFRAVWGKALMNRTKDKPVNRWFYGQDSYEFDRAREVEQDLYERILKQPVPIVPDTHYDSMWEFYKAIQWDYKRKKFT